MWPNCKVLSSTSSHSRHPLRTNNINCSKESSKSCSKNSSCNTKSSSFNNRYFYFSRKIQTFFYFRFFFVFFKGRTAIGIHPACHAFEHAPTLDLFIIIIILNFEHHHQLQRQTPIQNQCDQTSQQ